jgi:hypothetical protein
MRANVIMDASMVVADLILVSATRVLIEGRATVARIAVIEITINSSRRVSPPVRFFIVHP